jgi:hypothetical protein
MLAVSFEREDATRPRLVLHMMNTRLSVVVTRGSGLEALQASVANTRAPLVGSTPTTRPSENATSISTGEAHRRSGAACEAMMKRARIRVASACSAQTPSGRAT